MNNNQKSKEESYSLWKRLFDLFIGVSGILFGIFLISVVFFPNYFWLSKLVNDNVSLIINNLIKGIISQIR